MTARDRFGFCYTTERVVPEVSSLLQRGTAEEAITDGKRVDSRTCDQLRPLCLSPFWFIRCLFVFVVHDLFYCCMTVIQPGAVSQSSGSAYVELGQTKVICSVFVVFISSFHSCISHCSFCV